MANQKIFYCYTTATLATFQEKGKALKPLRFKAFHGEPGGIRTHDLLIRSQH